MTQPDRIQWLSDLIRAEIALWNRVDDRLRQEHNVSLAVFEVLHFAGEAQEGSLRVGDLARAVGITVGAASKLIDRVKAAGLISRQPDAEDRRASRIALTETGRHTLDAATITYTAELGALLDATLSAAEQETMHALMQRLLATVNGRETR